MALIARIYADICATRVSITHKKLGFCWVAKTGLGEAWVSR